MPSDTFTDPLDPPGSDFAPGFSAAPPAGASTTMASTQQHLFSTVVLRIGATGNVALATDGTATVGVVQDATLDVSFDRKELDEAAQVSNFKVDTADAGGKCTLKIGSADFNRLLLPYLAGMTKTTAGAVDTFTLGKTSKPQACRVEFDGVDTTGKNIKGVMQFAKGKGFSNSQKVTDMGSISYEFDSYPDANGNVLALAMDQ